MTTAIPDQPVKAEGLTELLRSLSSRSLCYQAMLICILKQLGRLEQTDKTQVVNDLRHILAVQREGMRGEEELASYDSFCQEFILFTTYALQQGSEDSSP